MRSRQKHRVEKTLRFLLIGGHYRGSGFDTLRERFAIGIEERLHAAFAGAGDQLRIKIGWRAGGQAAAQHQPCCAGEVRIDSALDARQLAAIEARADFVQLHGQAVAVDDGEVEPDIVANRDRYDGKAAALHVMFKAGAAIAPGGEYRESSAAEGMDHAGGVDAASAGGIFAGKNVGAVFEGQPVYGDCPIHRRVHGQGDDQLFMVAYGAVPAGPFYTGAPS
jgi:hypothetical protein